MKVEVKVTFLIKGLKKSLGKCILLSLKPDNVGLPRNSSILSKVLEDELKYVIIGEFDLNDFIHTWNDFMRCLKVVINLFPMLE